MVEARGNIFWGVLNSVGSPFRLPIVLKDYFHFLHSAGSVSDLTGIYKTIDRYTKLVFTWVRGVPLDGVQEETLVTLDFMPN